MAGGYREAAHAAFRACEAQEGLMPCVHPANNIVYCFLLEARRTLLQSATERGSDPGYLPRIFKQAADHVKDHPYRIHDITSAQGVPYIKANVSQIIVQHLFKAYPPEAPSWEEQEEERQQKAALKAAERLQKAQKRKADKASGGAAAAAAAAAAAGALGQPATARGGSGGGWAGPAGGLAEPGAGAEAAGEGAERPRKRAKAAKEYIPRIGSANYAFLVVLLEAMKGPTKRDYLTKQELMERAEASGLADKPISGEGNPLAGRGGGGGPAHPTQYYNSWSCMNKQLVNEHALVLTYSNPKKCALTSKGMDLAERLYRDAVGRGKMEAIQGIPTSGPFLFALPREAPDPTAASRWDKPSAAPAAAVAPSRAAAAASRPPAAARRGQGSGAAAAAAVAAAARGFASPPGIAVQPGPGAAAQPARRGQQTGAGAIAAALAAAGVALPPGGLPQSPCSMPSPAYRAAPAAMPAQPRRVPAPDAATAGLRNDGDSRRSGAAPGGSGGLGSSQLPGRGSSKEEDEVIDLSLGDELPLAARLAGRMGGGAAAAAAAAAVGVVAAASGVVADADLTVMVEMGYSDKKALRRSSNFEQALDLADALSSDSDSESEAGSDDGFFDAPEELPSAPPPLPAQPSTVRGGGRDSGSGGAPGGAAQQQKPQQEQIYVPARPGASQQQQQQAYLPARLGSSQQQQLDAWGSQQDSRALGHMRLGSQQGGGGHVRLGSQPSEGLAGWGGSQSQNPDEPSDAELLAAAGAALQGARPAAAQQRCGSGALAGAALRGPGAEAGPAGSSSSSSSSIRQRPEDLRLPPITPGRRFSDEYEVVFLVDGREQYSRLGQQGRSTALTNHIDQMRRSGLRIEQRTLKIGDALWVARSKDRPQREYVLDFIVERKSIDDLIGSIKGSNRYEKQKFWLRKCGLRHVNYLIEGDPDLLPNPSEQKAVKTAAANTEAIDRFRVLRTQGHAETFRLYQALTKRIEALYGPARPSAAAGASAGTPAASLAPSFAEWEAHMSRVQRENTTLHDVWALMLGAVPGLGTETVQTILQHFPTPFSLYTRYRQELRAAAGRDACDAAASVLLGLKRAGSGRGVGQDKALRVFQLLFGGGWGPSVAACASALAE